MTIKFLLFFTNFVLVTLTQFLQFVFVTTLDQGRKAFPG